MTTTDSKSMGGAGVPRKGGRLHPGVPTAMFAVRVPVTVLADAQLVAKAWGLTRQDGGVGSLLMEHSVVQVVAEAKRIRETLGLKEPA